MRYRRRNRWQSAVIAAWVLATACGPPTIEDPTDTPKVTPETSPTFAPGLDVDGDGFGVNEECDDTYDETYPGAEEVCDGRDNDCNGVVDDRDIDQDGYRAEDCGGTDCDDLNSSIRPNAEERCNGIDENCNGEIDEGATTTYYLDRDGDTYGDPNTTTEDCTPPAGYVTSGTDCRDQDPEIHPGQPETCNGLDDDCNGIIDDDLPLTPYYPDTDQDAYGDADSPAFETCDPSLAGYALNNDDCDDSNPDVHPGATEQCNQIDDDCDGFIDLDDPDGVSGYLTFYYDADGDGYGRTDQTEQGCDIPAGYADQPGDCDDTRDDVHPDSEETCDGMDNDCDGERDEEFDRATYYADDDQDGFGAGETLACANLDDPATAHLTAIRGDCDDTSAAVHPGATDGDGDGIDSDCGGHDAADPHVGLSAASWNTLQVALTAATPGTTIWVGPGTYREAGIDFLGKSVALRATAGQENTVIDAEQRGTAILFQSGEGQDAMLDGFTITGGVAAQGGAINLTYSSPTITACTIEGNTAESGGGMYLLGASPTITRTLVVNNQAGTEGGGISLKTSNPSLEWVTITGNTAVEEGGGLSLRASSPTLMSCVVAGNNAGLGGGAFLSLDAAPSIAFSTFSGNTATRGGGLYLDSAAPTLDNCTIAGNSSDEDGGGAYLKSSDPEFTNVAVTGNLAGTNGGGLLLSTSNPTVHNLVVSDNVAPYGAGMYLSASSPRLSHLLMIRNQADSQGGGLYLIETGTTPGIENSIVAYNTGDDIFNHPSYPAAPVITYTILYNPTGTDTHNLDTLDPTVLEDEPGFLSYDDQGRPDTWHLALSSPAIDAGTPDKRDADGSPADLGAFGGTFGNRWDLDGDGKPTYFWPGPYTAAPPGIDTEEYALDVQ